MDEILCEKLVINLTVYVNEIKTATNTIRHTNQTVIYFTRVFRMRHRERLTVTVNSHLLHKL